MSKSYIAEVICVLLPKFLFLLEPGECWRGFVQDKVHTPLICGDIQRGSRSMLKPKRGISGRVIFFILSGSLPPKAKFRVLLFFCLHIQTKGSMCPSGMSAEVTVNDSARSKHPKTTYTCVCGVPKPVLKNVAECSQHGMTWDRPKSWKMVLEKEVTLSWPYHFFLSVFETSYQMPISTNWAFEMQCILDNCALWKTRKIALA